MKRGKKAQTVMEFLLTYGWAILVVLIVLSALFYLGVFETETPEVCFIEAPFICKDFVVGDNYVSFFVAGKNIKSGTVTDVLINGQSCEGNPPIGWGGQIFVNNNIDDLTFNSDQIVNVTCDGISISGKVNAEIIVEYESLSGLMHTITGSGGGGGTTTSVGAGQQECQNGQTQNCSLQQGVCVGSFETCTNNVWPGCTSSNYGLNYEVTEISCSDGLDNDCDGNADGEDYDCPAYCGNNIIGPGEQCDGSQLGGQTCIGLGYSGGVLSCSNCTFELIGTVQQPHNWGIDFVKQGNYIFFSAAKHGRMVPYPLF